MTTKLTLTIDHSVIESAKAYARETNRSLSDIVENYLKAVSLEHRETEIEITPLVKSLKGSFSAPADYDYKKELAKALSEKYLP